LRAIVLRHCCVIIDDGCRSANICFEVHELRTITYETSHRVELHMNHSQYFWSIYMWKFLLYQLQRDWNDHRTKKISIRKAAFWMNFFNSFLIIDLIKSAFEQKCSSQNLNSSSVRIYVYYNISKETSPVIHNDGIVDLDMIKCN
jgi:hypothetical protein